MSRYCPSPHKDAFANRGEAKAVVKAMVQRNKRGKTKVMPPAPYQCMCGAVHLSDPRRVRALGKR